MATATKREPVTQARLKELLHYDPETGVFTWLVTRNNFVRAGRVAGVPNSSGHIQIMIDGRAYFAHRLAFLYVTGEWPRHHVDHINCEEADNRWLNLREATGTQNNANARRRTDNSTGYKGVSWYKDGRCYRAYIRKAGHLHYLGSFSEPQEAHAAYVRAADRMFGDFARAA